MVNVNFSQQKIANNKEKQLEMKNLDCLKLNLIFKWYYIILECTHAHASTQISNDKIFKKKRDCFLWALQDKQHTEMKWLQLSDLTSADEIDEQQTVSVWEQTLNDASSCSNPHPW